MIFLEWRRDFLKQIQIISTRTIYIVIRIILFSHLLDVTSGKKQKNVIMNSRILFLLRSLLSQLLGKHINKFRSNFRSELKHSLCYFQEDELIATMTKTDDKMTRPCEHRN